jgi:hypothetical protein
MANRSKAKGSAAEKLVAEWYAANGWPHAERRVTEGRNDRGDVSGVPGVVIEVKDAATLRLYEWIDETERERVADGAEFGVLVVKRYGSLDVSRWYAIMTVESHAEMLKEIFDLRARLDAARDVIEALRLDRE